MESQVTQEPTIVDWITMRNPTTFQVPKIIYWTERCGFACQIISQLPGRSLEAVLTDTLGYDDEGFLYDAEPTSPQAMNARQICTVSRQAADAIMEMSTWEAPPRLLGVSGVDGNFPPDINLYEGVAPFQTRDELFENLDHAGLDWKNPIFSPGDISPENIILDKDNNFVGFNRLAMASFAPRGWISVAMIDPTAQEEADIKIWLRAGLCGKYYIPRGGPNSILLAWSNLLWERLAVYDGFVKVDPHRLPWLRRRSPEMQHMKWRDIDMMMREKVKSSWK